MRIPTAQILAVLLAVVPSTLAAASTSASSSGAKQTAAVRAPNTQGGTPSYLFPFRNKKPKTVSGETPYDVLGVRVSTPIDDITEAYNTKMGKFRLLPGRKQAIQKSYETLVDPHKRCIYHRDSNTPDWYGVPWSCWLERGIDKFKVAKVAAINRWGARDVCFAKMSTVVQSLYAQVPVWKPKDTPKDAKKKTAKKWRIGR